MGSSDIYRYVFSLGVSPKHKGFVYICDALSLILASGEQVFDSSEALSAVCEKHGTDRRAAERCMRYAVCCAWDSQGGSLRGAFAEVCPGALSAGRLSPAPSLTEFLHVALWRMRGEN